MDLELKLRYRCSPSKSKIVSLEDMKS